MTAPLNVRVVRWERTGTVFPCDWDVRLSDGRVMYVRYRNGGLGFGVGDSMDEAIGNHQYHLASPHGEGGGAFITDTQMIEAMREFGVDFQNAERIGPPCESYL